MSGDNKMPETPAKGGDIRESTGDFVTHQKAGREFRRNNYRRGNKAITEAVTYFRSRYKSLLTIKDTGDCDGGGVLWISRRFRTK